MVGNAQAAPYGRKMTDFEEFMKERKAAADAYVRGDPEPLGRLVARQSAATFFGPRGGHVQGAEQVWAGYERDAAAFGADADNTLQVLDAGADGQIAYWVGYQRSSVTLAGKPTQFNLRITEVFRREDDGWKLVHRHADPMAQPPTPEPIDE